MLVPVPNLVAPAVLVSAVFQSSKLSCEHHLTVSLSYVDEPSGLEPNTTMCLSGVDTNTTPTLVGIEDASPPTLVTYCPRVDPLYVEGAAINALISK